MFLREGGSRDRDEGSWDITLQWEGEGIRIHEISDRPSLETRLPKKPAISMEL